MTTKILLGLALMCPLASWAADDPKPFDGKPGLWETTFTTQIAGLPDMPTPVMPQLDPEVMKNMPPEVRAQMEAAMKGRGSAGAPRAQAVKSCLTRESFTKGFQVQDQTACTQKLMSTAADKMTVHVECTQGPLHTAGDMTVERVDAEHVKGNMVSKANEGGERSMEMKISFTSKWVSADCGDVKPAGQK